MIRAHLLALVLLVGSAVLGACATDPPLPAEQPVQTRDVSLPEAQQATDPPVIAGYTVSIPKLSVRSPLVDLGLNPDRTVQVPPLDQPALVGHYRSSPRPGATGPAVLLGHVNGRVDGRAIPGAFARLDTLVEGDHVDVTAPDGLATRTVRFTVYRVSSVPKDQFPTSAVYGNTPGPELRLITCGGAYDAANRNFLSNVIAYARADS